MHDCLSRVSYGVLTPWHLSEAEEASGEQTERLLQPRFYHFIFFSISTLQLTSWSVLSKTTTLKKNNVSIVLVAFAAAKHHDQ